MNEPPVLHHMAALADGARARLLHLLEAHELTVSELCTVVQLPQSTVSRQLGVLREEGWVTSRAEGTSRYYRLAESLEPVTRRLWEVVREPLSGTTEARQ